MLVGTSTAFLDPVRVAEPLLVPHRGLRVERLRARVKDRLRRGVGVGVVPPLHLVGLLAGAIPFLACTKLKGWLKYDDALDTFGVHAVGGTLGAILTGVLATSEVNGNLTSVNTYAAANGLDKLVADGGLLGQQLIAIGITLVISVVATAVIALVLKAVMGLRPTAEEETAGLDINDHGEEGYNY